MCLLTSHYSVNGKLAMQFLILYCFVCWRIWTYIHGRSDQILMILFNLHLIFSNWRPEEVVVSHGGILSAPTPAVKSWRTVSHIPPFLPPNGRPGYITTCICQLPNVISVDLSSLSLTDNLHQPGLHGPCSRAGSSRDSPFRYRWRLLLHLQACIGRSVLICPPRPRIFYSTYSACSLVTWHQENEARRDLFGARDFFFTRPPSQFFTTGRYLFVAACTGSIAWSEQVSQPRKSLGRYVDVHILLL